MFERASGRSVAVARGVALRERPNQGPRVGIAGIEARRKIGDPPADGLHGVTQHPGATPAGSGPRTGLTAEERAAAEGARRVNAAAARVRQQGAWAARRQRETAPISKSDPGGAHPVAQLRELYRGRVGLAAGEIEPTAEGLWGVVAGRRPGAAAARPALEELVHLGVQGA